MNSIRLSTALAGIVSLGACATAPIPAPQPSWKQTTGQIQASGGSVALVGDIAIRYDQENFLAEITKGPGLPLLRLYAKGAHGEQIVASGALGRGSWSGPAASAPAALQAWAALPEVFHWAQAQARGDQSYRINLQGVTTGGRRAGGTVTYLEYQRGGEKVVARLQR